MTRYRLAIILLTVLLLCGCRSAPGREHLVGRWLEVGERNYLDLGDKNLYAFYTLEQPVEVGSWKLEGDRLRLTPSLQQEAESAKTWQISFTDDQTFRYQLNEARYREFKKSRGERVVDERLLGLWTTDGENPDTLEFTPHGTLIGLVWRRDNEGELFKRGLSAKVSTAGTDKFYIEGQLGTGQLTKSTAQSYKFEDNRLVWNKRKLRQITSF